MTFEIQRERALAMLRKTGMWRSQYEPLEYRLLWRMGCKIPPPHFTRFWPTALVYGLCFSLLFGGVFWLTAWSEQDITVLAALADMLSFGLLLGLFAAAIYAEGRRRYKLPSWESLASDTPPAWESPIDPDKKAPMWQRILSGLLALGSAVAIVEGAITEIGEYPVWIIASIVIFSLFGVYMFGYIALYGQTPKWLKQLSL